ncbi:glycosyltransferase [Actinobacillus porcinus]|uniref:glycosyltransferase n=1 Tax=Actinobacillus porcinus TaxID=51048 RepID=UPI0023532335|nr:glycosyltransferase [Actinobacillus porcinus]MCI5763059.1 glycosyltransferase [Actinobacillus porcinus]MDY5420612.1 glycosyltransferase [Actinobacillus porcinus]
MNPTYPIFLSVIVPNEWQDDLIPTLSELTKNLSALVNDYELIVVDNASSDNVVEGLRQAASLDGLPNLQVYCLTKEVDYDTLAWVGLENALGDFSLVFNPYNDDISLLPEMLEKALSGKDVVFAANKEKKPSTFGYRLADNIFNLLYKWFHKGFHLNKDAPQFRLLSKRIVNFIMQHNQPVLGYRYLPATSGFSKEYIQYKSPYKQQPKKPLLPSIAKGIRLMIATTNVPMRLVTTLSLFGATANVIYSLYIMAVLFFAENVAPGWASLSLQMSGMFFLISLVLCILSEYVLYIADQNSGKPKYHLGQEFTSANITRLQKLNVEEENLHYGK